VAISLARAINAALRDAMNDDDRVVVFGEDVGTLGGVFRVTDGLQKEFGETRCFDTPLAEAGIVGTAIGMAMFGLVPVVEMQFDGFSYPAMNQVICHVAKYRNRTRSTVSLPLVIRIPYGGGIGAVEHHSESPEAYFAHTAGLTVVVPSSPSDAYALLRASIASPEPVVYLEPKGRYWSTQDLASLSTDVPIGKAAVRHQGSDVSLIAYGPAVRVALEAAEAARDEGIHLEVIDLRTLAPMDFDTVVESVRRTGRAIVVHEASRFLGPGAEIAAQISERAFEHLHAPVLRVAGFDVPYPPAKLERWFLPDADRVLDAVDRVMGW